MEAVKVAELQLRHRVLFAPYVPHRKVDLHGTTISHNDTVQGKDGRLWIQGEVCALNDGE